MTRKEFEAFTRLDASDVNTFLMDQSVMSFAGTAARGSAIGTAVEGLVTYLEDSNILSIYDGSDWKTSLAPTGSILQVVMGTTTTTTTTTSVVGVDTALSVSITPSSASNKILVISNSAQMSHTNNSAASELKLRRDSTDLNASTAIYFGTNTSGLNVPVSLSILDAPNTTSSVTYKTRISTGNSSNSTTITGRQNIIVMEVAG
jgi:hypothetical protein